jgi:cobalamin biosynthesis Mg chelatase CobN
MEPIPDVEPILIVIVVVLLFGGGYWGRRHGAS